MGKYESQRFRRKIDWFTNGAIFKSFYIIFICFNLQHESAADVCSNPQCQKTAQTILKNMLPSVNPCDDFFGFACGGYKAPASVPDDEVGYDYEDQQRDVIDEQIESLFNSSYQSKPPSTALKNAQDFYLSCLDEKTIEKRSLGELKAQLKRIGGWPVLETKWNENKFDLTNTKIQLQKEGLDVDALFSIDVVLDRDSKKYILVVSEGELGLDKTFLLQGLNSSVVQTYMDTLVNLSVELGASSEQAKKDMSDAIEFEYNMAKILDPIDDSGYFNDSNIRTTIEKLEKNLPFISWYKLFSESFKGATSVSRKQQIVVNTDYLTQLSQLLKNTPKRTLVNYMIAQSVLDEAPYLTKKMQLIVHKKEELMYGVFDLPPRRDICLAELKDRFDQVVSAAYVQKYLDQKTKAKVEQLVSQLQAELLNVLDAASWMSPLSLKNSKKKAKSLSYSIGAPTELYNYNLLDDFFKKLKTDSGDFYGNVVATDIFFQNFQFSLLNQVVDKNPWYAHEPSYEIDVAYSTLYHVMDIPAAAVNMLYSSGIEDYLNIALFGNTIASRQIDLFDEEGIEFDEDSDEGPFWDNITYTECDKRKEELAGLYSNQIVDPDNNDTASLYEIVEEMISVQGGLKIAYQLFQKIATRKEQDSLINLEQFSPAQLFWMWMASGFCYQIMPNTTNLNIKSGDNLITKLEINGPLQNSPNFASTWNCNKNSYMNPETKINVW